MPEGRLFIGSKRYSSWSLRGWLAVRLAGLDVEEVVIPLGRRPVRRPSAPRPRPALVPYLEHRGAQVWESLAIAEYCAELAPALWPADRARPRPCPRHRGRDARRLPRAAGRHADEPRPRISPAAAATPRRWPTSPGSRRSGARRWPRIGGPFLLGADFTLADAMFAPVVARFLTWAAGACRRSPRLYGRRRAHPLLQRWYAEAAAEPEPGRSTNTRTRRGRRDEHRRRARPRRRRRPRPRPADRGL